jgi:hypothetical protein
LKFALLSSYLELIILAPGSSKFIKAFTRSKTMSATEPDYFNAYRSLKLARRDAAGVLVAAFHTRGGPLTFTAGDHSEFVEAFALRTLEARQASAVKHN